MPLRRKPFVLKQRVSNLLHNEIMLTQNESVPIEISTKIWYNLTVKQAESMRRWLDKVEWKVERYADKRY